MKIQKNRSQNLLMGETCENRSADCQHVKHIVPVGSNSSTSLGLYPKELKTCPHKNLYMKVQSATIQNNRRMKQFQCPSTD